MALAVQLIGYVGANITHSAAAALDTAPPGDRRFLWVKNGSGVSTSVTVAVPGTSFGLANPDAVIAVAAGAEKMIGPLDAGLGEPSQAGNVLLGITPITSITVAYVELPGPPPGFP